MNTESIEKFVNKALGEIDILGHVVPAINAPIILMDDIRPILQRIGAPFTAMYWDEPDGRVFVLMSGGEVDVGEVAKAYRGTGDQATAVFRTPPQREMAGEFIPVDLEFPPDDTVVIGLQADRQGVTFARQVHHVKDGQFDAEDVVAWAWMPELCGFNAPEPPQSDG